MQQLQEDPALPGYHVLESLVLICTFKAVSPQKNPANSPCPGTLKR